VIAQRVSRAFRLARFRSLRALYDTFGSESTPDGRARKLLLAWLSAEQRQQFRELGHFEVVGGTTGKRYRILPGTCANVLELNDAGEPVSGICFVPEGRLAAGDVMLAQKIALETSEVDALAVGLPFPSQLPFRLPRHPQRPF
jgi:hypothetical protein